MILGVWIPLFCGVRARGARGPAGGRARARAPLGSKSRFNFIEPQPLNAFQDIYNNMCIKVSVFVFRSAIPLITWPPLAPARPAAAGHTRHQNSGLNLRTKSHRETDACNVYA